MVFLELRCQCGVSHKVCHGLGGTLSRLGFLLPPLTGGYSVALVLDELLDEAPVTWFRS